MTYSIITHLLWFAFGACLTFGLCQESKKNQPKPKHHARIKSLAPIDILFKIDNGIRFKANLDRDSSGQTVVTISHEVEND